MAAARNAHRRSLRGILSRLEPASWVPLLLLLVACGITAHVARDAAPDLAKAIEWRHAIYYEDTEHPEHRFRDVAAPYLQRHGGLFLLLAAPAVIVAFLRGRGVQRAIVAAAFCLALFGLWISGDIAANFTAASATALGEVPTPGTYLVKLSLVAFTILSPPVFLWLYYTRATTLDRYVLARFMVPFFLCLIGFVAIWLVMDLADNGPDFIGAENPPPFETIAKFYLARTPQTLVLTLDITLLLSMLYTLGKMSRSNEIISMLGAGLSTWRILLPLFLFSAYVSLLSLACNFEWAPQADRKKDALLQSLDEEDYQQTTAATSVFYVNRADRRSWFVGTIPIDPTTSNKLRNVEVYSLDEDGHLAESVFARSAYWFPPRDEESDGIWRFYDATLTRYDDEGLPALGEDGDYLIEVFDDPDRLDYPYTDPDPKLSRASWGESIWKLQSGSLNPGYLGVAELRSYIATNHDLPERKLAPFRTQLADRWALPWRCFVVALIAAPLGIVYNRRGLLGGVASSIIIYFLIFFVTAVSLSMGEAGHFNAHAAAWLTNAAFAVVGLTLLYFRGRNRDFPVPRLGALFRRGAAATA